MLSDPSNIPLRIVLIIVLILINGVIVLANTAFESISRSKVRQMADEDGNEKAARLKGLIEKPSKYRITNRLLNYCLFIIIILLSFNLPYNKIVSMILVLVTTISLGELFPRKVAQQHSESIALSFTDIQVLVDIVLSPIVFILNIIADVFLLIFKQKTDMEESNFSEDQVMSMLEAGQESGEIKEEGKKMINSIFQFDDELAYEIMTPRTNVFFIDINDSNEEYLEQLMKLRYSRIPVCEDETDNIIGILHIKDYLIKAREDGFDKVDIRAILRKPYFVPETKNIDALFFELQKSKQHIAILIDEYGGFSGIVTMEDIIEEVMGDIDDEYDEEDHIIDKVDDRNYYVDGSVSLDDLNEETNISLESENSETIGGFIIDILGEIPEDGDENREVEFENYVFTILSVKEKRIEKIKIYIKPESTNEDTSEKENSEEKA